MTLITTAELVAAADHDGRAVLAFNVVTLEHAEGIVDGLADAGGRHGAILQLSENSVRFHRGDMAPLLAACAALAAHASTPIALHLDHFQDLELIEAAIADAPGYGVSSLMIDAAHLPYDENVSRTRDLGARARAAGLWVEAELGEIGGKLGAHAAGVRTDPAEATDFVAHTGVDALAVAVGSSHAMTTRDAGIDVDLVAALSEAVPVPLVLHGGSGVSDDVLRAAVRAGMRKLNVGTALNVAFTAAVREGLAERPDAHDPRGCLELGRAAVARTVAARVAALDPQAVR